MKIICLGSTACTFFILFIIRCESMSKWKQCLNNGMQTVAITNKRKIPFNEEQHVLFSFLNNNNNNITTNISLNKQKLMRINAIHERTRDTWAKQCPRATLLIFNRHCVAQELMVVLSYQQKQQVGVVVVAGIVCFV